MRVVRCPLGHRFEVAQADEPERRGSPGPYGTFAEETPGQKAERGRKARELSRAWDEYKGELAAHQEERRTIDVGKRLRVRTWREDTSSARDDYPQWGEAYRGFDFVYEPYYVCPDCGVVFRPSG